jgi:hypothetical protein
MADQGSVAAPTAHASQGLPWKEMLIAGTIGAIIEQPVHDAYEYAKEQLHLTPESTPSPAAPSGASDSSVSSQQPPARQCSKRTDETMRFRLRAAVEGELRFNEPIGPGYALLGEDGLAYEFFTGPDVHLITFVAVSQQVPAETFRTSMTPGGKGDIDFTVKADVDLQIYDALRAALQRLESHLSFMAPGLRRIRWDRPFEDRMPETPDEAAELAVASLGVHRQRIPPSGAIRLTDVQQLLSTKLTLLEPLVSFRAFDREGANEYQDFRWIQAFYMYFFVIEGMYAEGKSGIRQVLDLFSRSSELAEATSRAMKQVEPHQRHWPSLQRFLAEEGCSWDVAGVQRLLYLIRGRLHHYADASSRKQATPFSGDHFECVAYLAQAVSTNALLLREATLNGTPDRTWWIPGALADLTASPTDLPKTRESTGG